MKFFAVGSRSPKSDTRSSSVNHARLSQHPSCRITSFMLSDLKEGISAEHIGNAAFVTGNQRNQRLISMCLLT
jgi:hypothetical protein